MIRTIQRFLLPGLAGLALLATAALAQTGEKSDTRTERAWLGLFIRNLDRDDIRALDVAEDVDGVVVSGVDDMGPAARAGIEPGDVITHLDGRPVGGQQAFVETLRDRRAGSRARLTVLRQGRTRIYDLELEQRPSGTEAEPPRSGKRGRTPQEYPQALLRLAGLGPRLGVQVMDLDDADLAAYFGVRAGAGVLVTRVTDVGGAAKAGIKAGDVILRVEDRDVETVRDLRLALADRASGDSVLVLVRRSNDERQLRVELGGGEPDLGVALPSRDLQTRRLADDLERLRRELQDLRRKMQNLDNEVRSRERR